MTGLPRSYGRSDSCRRHLPDRSPRFRYPAFPPFRLHPPQGTTASLSHATPQLAALPSRRPPRAPAWFVCAPQQRPPVSRPRLASSHQVWTSPFARRLVAPCGRFEFVILRTGGSPPAASHLASQRCSDVQFRAGERLPDGDFHPADQVPSRAHERGRPGRPGFRDRKRPGWPRSCAREGTWSAGWKSPSGRRSPARN